MPDSQPRRWYALAMAGLTVGRQPIARRGKRLEYFTIAWNTLEGLVAVVAGAFAGRSRWLGLVLIVLLK